MPGNESPAKPVDEAEEYTQFSAKLVNRPQLSAMKLFVKTKPQAHCESQRGKYTASFRRSPTPQHSTPTSDLRFQI